MPETSSPSSSSSDPSPQQIGPYRILDLLGQGGMGEVYVAEQSEPVKRRVALKVIKLGMDSREVVARFQQERQALALMAHDGIAKVYDVGTTERGQPYFVMELVKGVPLHEYCDAHKLGLKERIALMQQVCAAVTHAHQKGVVHRDLKPGNVLVADNGGAPQAKVIDFGLAKAMGQKLVEATLFTEAGRIVGTPEYMAPEQADPTNADIDTRVDVYSLGVMLYETLVGSLPFASDRLRRAGLAGIQQVLREEEPPRPSHKLSTLGPASTAVCQARRISTAALQKALRTDLDWVVLKAMEKDRSRRYDSPAALAADLQRYLDHEPLLAGPPSAMYRLQKLVRRYRGQFVAAGLVGATLVAGGIGTFVQWRRAEQSAEEARRHQVIAVSNEQRAVASEQQAQQRAEDNARLAAAEAKAKERAQRMAAEVAAVVDFQTRQLAVVDTWHMGQDLREAIRRQLARRLNDNGALQSDIVAATAALDAITQPVDFTAVVLDWLEKSYFKPTIDAIDAQFHGQELLQARLLHVVAGSMGDLGMTVMALEAQERALVTRTRLLGPAAAETLDSRSNRANLLYRQGNLQRAEQELRATIFLSETLDDADPRAVINSKSSLAAVLLADGRPAEAADVLGEALATSRRESGSQDSTTLHLLHNLSQAMGALGRHEEAIALAESVVQMAGDATGPAERRDLLSMKHGLGKLLAEHGDAARAEDILRETLSGLVAERGGDHPDTLATMEVLVNLLLEGGRPEEAETLLQKYVEGRRQALGAVDRVALVAMDNLGLAWLQSGNSEKAVFWLREAVSGFNSVQGPHAKNTLFAVNHLGSALYHQKKYQDAHDMFAAAMSGLSNVLGQWDKETLTCRMSHALSLARLNRDEESLRLLAQVFSDAKEHLGEADQVTNHAFSNMVILHLERDQVRDAKSLLADRLARTSLAKDHPVVVAMQEAHDSLKVE